MARKLHSQGMRPAAWWGLGLLLVLPVAVLTGLGIVALRQDRLAVQREARERADYLASGLADQAWRALQSASQEAITWSQSPVSNRLAADALRGGHRGQSYAFQLDSQGQLAHPPPFPAAPPSQDPGRTALAPRQLQLWANAQAAEYVEQDTPKAIASLEALLAAGEPAPFTVRACYFLGVLRLKQAEWSAGRALLEEVSHRHPGVLAESGLPLKTLADTHLVRLLLKPGAIAAGKLAAGPPADQPAVTPATTSPSLQAWLLAACAHAMENPSPASRPLLALAEEAWPLVSPPPSARPLAALALWERDETARLLHRACAKTAAGRAVIGASLDTGREGAVDSALPEPGRLELETGATRLAWVEGQGSWLASRTPGSRWVAALPVLEVQNLLARLVAANSNAIPGYCSVRFEAAGRAVAGPSAAGPSPGQVLASAARLGGQIKVAIALSQPAILFARQEQRTTWFGILVAASSLGTLAGLGATGLAYWRQRHLNQLKSNFVSSVSHELRAPIASLRLMAESLAQGRVPGEARRQEYFQCMIQECRRLGALIENALDFARIEQGRCQYEFEPTDLGEVIHQILEIMEPAAAARKITLRRDPGPGGAALPDPAADAPAQAGLAMVDGRAIQQALLNLVDNALKYSPAGSEVRIGLAIPSQGRPPSTGPGWIELWVQDQGPGVPPAERRRIFEWFYRVGNELRRETQGAGIGLAIVHHIVQAHRGQVFVADTPSQGSRFVMRLPAAETLPWNES